jgi:hypothetical protein
MSWKFQENNGKCSCGGKGDLYGWIVEPPACPIARTDSTGEIIATHCVIMGSLRRFIQADVRWHSCKFSKSLSAHLPT